MYTAGDRLLAVTATSDVIGMGVWSTDGVPPPKLLMRARDLASGAGPSSAASSSPMPPSIIHAHCSCWSQVTDSRSRSRQGSRGHFPASSSSLGATYLGGVCCGVVCLWWCLCVTLGSALPTDVYSTRYMMILARRWWPSLVAVVGGWLHRTLSWILLSSAEGASSKHCPPVSETSLNHLGHSAANKEPKRRDLNLGTWGGKSVMTPTPKQGGYGQATQIPSA